METALNAVPAATSAKRLNLFERYLTLWVALCMIVGVVLGKTIPGFIQSLRFLELGRRGGTQRGAGALAYLQVEDARAFLTDSDLDLDTLAPQVDRRFASAFIRTREPVGV